MGSLGLWIPGNPKLFRNLPTFVAHSEISEPFQDLDTVYNGLADCQLSTNARSGKQDSRVG